MFIRPAPINRKRAFLYDGGAMKIKRAAASAILALILILTARADVG